MLKYVSLKSNEKVVHLYQIFLSFLSSAPINISSFIFIFSLWPAMTSLKALVFLQHKLDYDLTAFISTIVLYDEADDVFLNNRIITWKGREKRSTQFAIMFHQSQTNFKFASSLWFWRLRFSYKAFLFFQQKNLWNKFLIKSFS
jgi:hypothetical protein